MKYSVLVAMVLCALVGVAMCTRESRSLRCSTSTRRCETSRSFGPRNALHAAHKPAERAAVFTTGGATSKIVWHQSQPEFVYEDAVIFNQGKSGAAVYEQGLDGSTLQLFSPLSSSKPLSSFSPPNEYGISLTARADATRQSSVLAVAQTDYLISGRYMAATYLIDSQSTTPTYSQHLSDLPYLAAGADTHKTIGVTSDGQTAMFAYSSMNLEGAAISQFVENDKSSSTVIVNGSLVVAADISSDGSTLSGLFSLTDATALNVAVHDVQANKWIFNTTVDAANAMGFCSSPDGSHIVYGFFSFSAYVKGADGKYHTSASVQLPSDMYLGACAVSNDGFLAIALSDYHTFSSTYVSAYQIKGNNVNSLWSWASPDEPNPQKVQDAIASAVLTNDASVFVYASWGTGTGNTPTVRAFLTKPSSSNAPGTNKPFFEFVTPGSPFAVDVYGGSKGLSLLVGGKKVHANIMGDGGDLYLIQTVPSNA